MSNCMWWLTGRAVVVRDHSTSVSGYCGEIFPLRDSFISAIFIIIYLYLGDVARHNLAREGGTGRMQ